MMKEFANVFVGLIVAIGLLITSSLFLLAALIGGLIVVLGEELVGKLSALLRPKPPSSIANLGS